MIASLRNVHRLLVIAIDGATSFISNGAIVDFASRPHFGGIWQPFGGIDKSYRVRVMGRIRTQQSRHVLLCFQQRCIFRYVKESYFIIQM